MVSTAEAAEFCWSDARSVSSGNCLKRFSNLGAQVFNSSRFESVTVYWYCVREERPPTRMSCPACRNRLTPCTLASCGRSRVMISSALAVRPSSFGFRLMKKLPVLKVDELPFMPKPVMSGSRRTTSASSSMREFIEAKEASCADSAKPEMKPVSCCGKKPLGMIANSTPVATSVAMKTHSVMNWWSSTTCRPRL